MPDATYYKSTDDKGREVFHCLYCAGAGQEHHATDPALFASHMEQRHDGRLVEGQKPDEPTPAEEGEGEDAPPPPPEPSPEPVPTPEPAPVPDTMPPPAVA
jgi:outer membrane biosynthesis protein TonB